MFQTFDCDAIMSSPNESTVEAPGEAKDDQTGDTIEAIKTVFSCRMEQGDFSCRMGQGDDVSTK